MPLQSWMAPRRRIAFERPCLRWTTSSQKCSWPASSLSRVDVPRQGRYGRRSPCSAPSTLTTWPALCAASPWRRALWAGRRQRQPGVVDVCVGRPAWPSTRSRRPWPSRSCGCRASHSGRGGGFPSRSAAMVGTDAGACGLRGASAAPCGRPYRPRQQRHWLRFRARASRVASGRHGGGSSGLAHGMAERVGLGRSLCGAVSRRRRSLPGLVADWALALPPLSSASSTAPLARPVLPWGAVPSEDRAISTASREALALETTSEAIYELADETNEEGV